MPRVSKEPVLARDGISVARVFLPRNARSDVRFERDGVPVGIDAAVLPDIDAMLAAARRHSSTRIPEVLDAAKHAGYEGALAWSVLAEDEHSAYPPLLAEWVRAGAIRPDADG